MIYTKSRLKKFAELLGEVHQQHPELSLEDRVHRAVYRLNALHGHLTKKVFWIVGGIIALLILGVLSARAQDVNVDRVGGTLQTTDTLKVSQQNSLPAGTNVIGHIICDSGCSSGGGTDTTVTGNITTAGVDCSVATNCVSASLSAVGAVGIQISGTWTGTVQFEANIDSANFKSASVLPIFPIAGSVTSTTANGTWTIPAAGVAQFRLRASALSSGTVAVTLLAAQKQFAVGLYDPKISGPDAQGVAQTQGPLLQGGRDYTGNVVKAIGLDPTTNAQLMNINNTVTVALPQQPFLNTTDFTDVLAASPTRGDLIVANSTPKWARFPIGAANTLLHGGTDPTWSAVVQGDVTGGYCDTSTNQTCAGNKAFTGLTSIGQLNGKIYIDGVKYAISQAGIQSAINDACTVNAYGSFATDIYVPPMIINLTNTTTQQFLLTCSVNIHGSGIWATWFVVDASVPSTIPLFRIKPNTTQSEEYIEFDHFRAVGNTSGGDVFFFDGTGVGSECCFRIHDIMSLGMSANAWFINSSGTVVSFGWSHVWDNNLYHGIKMNTVNTTDSWLIEHNVFNNTAGSTNPCIDASTASGASMITVFNNNGGCTGGFFTSTQTNQCKILYNQIEETSGTGDTNNSLVDLLGTTTNIDGCEIIGNNFNVHNTATNNIRLGTTTNTHIEYNTFAEKPTTGVGILVTANSTGTQIGYNKFIDSNTAGALTGGQIAVTNSGVSTNSGTNDWALNKTGQADIVADSAAINTTDTIIVKTSAFPANRAFAGTHFRITLTGTCTSTVANASTFTLRWGTAGTTADGTVAALVSSVAAASGTNNGFRTVIDLTVRVPGASATSSAFMELISDGNIGIVATPNEKFVAGTAFNTTTASAILSLSYKSAAATTTSTFKDATIEIVQN